MPLDNTRAEGESSRARGTRLILSTKKQLLSICLGSILAEDAIKAAKPLGRTAFLHWPKITVKAGATRVVSISPEGILR